MADLFLNEIGLLADVQPASKKRKFREKKKETHEVRRSSIRRQPVQYTPADSDSPVRQRSTKEKSSAVLDDRSCVKMPVERERRAQRSSSFFPSNMIRKTLEQTSLPDVDYKATPRHILDMKELESLTGTIFIASDFRATLKNRNSHRCKRYVRMDRSGHFSTADNIEVYVHVVPCISTHVGVASLVDGPYLVRRLLVYIVDRPFVVCSVNCPLSFEQHHGGNLSPSCAQITMANCEGAIDVFTASLYDCNRNLLRSGISDYVVRVNDASTAALFLSEMKLSDELSPELDSATLCISGLSERRAVIIRGFMEFRMVAHALRRRCTVKALTNGRDASSQTL